MRVHTLTCNLLAETTYTYSSWRAGATQRAHDESFQVGGKGINVTRMLTRLGTDSVALLFSGGATGARCEAWLHERGIPYHAFLTPAETRTGAVVRAPEVPETTFLGSENVLGPEAIAVCAAYLDAQPAGDPLVISGSIPNWEEASCDPLREAVRKRLRHGPVVVDTYGPPLQWFASLSVGLIKINRREFADLAGVDENDTDDERMPALLREVSARHRAAAWAITDGPGTVWFCTSGHRSERIDPPPIKEVSPTGSGDVLTAGVVFAQHIRSLDLGAAIRFALPLAAANAAHPGVAEFDLAPLVDFTTAT